jgi:hypothetical protein
MSSDTTAFLAGCAITGVAAVLLLRGGFVPDNSRAVRPVPPPPATAAPLAPPDSGSSLGERSPTDTQQTEQLQEELRRYEDLTENLQEQLERQREETQELREQLDRQRTDTETLVSQLQQQLQDQQRIIDTMNVQQQLDAADQSRVAERLWLAERQAELSGSPRNSNDVQSTILWIIGVTLIVVALGGGVLLILIVILLIQSQRRYASPPMPLFPTHMPPYTLTGQPLLPPPPRPRRTMPVEYYED